MGILDRLERSLDRGVSSVFNRGRGGVKPLELAQGIRRECDTNAAILGRDRTLAPNLFTVHLARDDSAQFEGWRETLVEELVQVVVDHGTKQNYTFVGSITVRLDEDEDMRPGRWEISSSTQKTTVAPATDSSPKGLETVIDIDGQQYLLTGPVTVIGRGNDADIILEDTGVSRHHLEIRSNGREVLVEDLGSTNGTLIDGKRTTGPTPIFSGQDIRAGRTTITLIDTSRSHGNGE